MGAGGAMLLVSIVGLWLTRKGRLPKSKLVWILGDVRRSPDRSSATPPAGSSPRWAASPGRWSACTGRRTRCRPRCPAGPVLTSLIVFTLLYGILAIIEVGLVVKYVKIGPPSEAEALAQIRRGPPRRGGSAATIRTCRAPTSRKRSRWRSPTDARVRRSARCRNSVGARAVRPSASWRSNPPCCLNNFWFLLIARAVDRLLRAGGFRLRGRRAAAPGRQGREGPPGPDQHHRADLGRQRGVAGHRRRRHLRRVPGVVRVDVLRRSTWRCWSSWSA